MKKLENGLYKCNKNPWHRHLVSVDGDDLVMMEVKINIVKVKNDYEFPDVWTKISKKEYIEILSDVVSMLEKK